MLCNINKVHVCVPKKRCSMTNNHNIFIFAETAFSYWVSKSQLGKNDTCCEFVYDLLAGPSPKYQVYSPECSETTERPGVKEMEGPMRAPWATDIWALYVEHNVYCSPPTEKNGYFLMLPSKIDTLKTLPVDSWMRPATGLIEQHGRLFWSLY